MKKIQMVDLQTQYEFIKNKVDSSVLEAFRKGTFINGPSVSQFQSNLESYLNVKHVIPCANGTDALQIALMSLDLKPGDEIITSDFSFVACIEVIALLKLNPVLVDVDLETFNIDCNKVIKAITPNTKAIIPVHLFGQVVISGEVNAIKEACLKLTKVGARRALILPVGGAFHSPLMEDAKEKLSIAINNSYFNQPICPIYQNVNGIGEKSLEKIKENLISQLTSPVKWTQSVNQMIKDGTTEFIEIGPGKVLQGLVNKIDRNLATSFPDL